MNYHDRIEAINKEIEKGCDAARLKVLRKKLYAISDYDLDYEDWVQKHTIIVCIKEMLALPPS